tara:strand:- start:433 stop:1284 length:852 start_codon:yes stop_codon:yes gene_type:complete
MAEENEKIPFYTQFSEKRNNSNKNLSEIAESTKINIKYLEAIELGDFDILPNVYIRLFLRSYAEYLELNAEKILSEYNEYINISNQQLKSSGVSYIKKKSKIEKKELPTIEDKKTTKESYSEHYFLRPKKIILLLLTIISIAFVYMSLYYLSNKQKERIELTEINDGIIKEYNKNINFNQNEKIKLKIINNKATKMKIFHKDSSGAFEVLCNDDTKTKEDLYKYDLNEDNVYFEINNPKHISEISINENSILNLLDKQDEEIYLVKGHVNRLENLVNIKFYNK